MKLANTGPQESNALVGGRISREEIDKVIPMIERILLQCNIQLGRPVADSLLGSSGSTRSMCGDIDIAVPVEILNNGGRVLSCHPHIKSCSQHGNVISLIIAIPGGEISHSQLRNGLVQVDLIGGEFEWLKQFYHSDSKSSFKGAHRNLMISAYLAHFRVKTYKPEWDDKWVTDNGPIFSQKNGICDRTRERVAKEDGTPYNSKFITVTSNHSYNLTNSAVFYFGSCYPHAFNSFEELIQSIEECYDEEYVSGIYQRFFADYLKDLPHLNADTFPWSNYPRLDAIRLKLLQR